MNFKRPTKQHVNAGSMADIAFLLLIFFLVTTQIQTDKGLQMRLPPKNLDDPVILDINERNVFKILINSQDQLLVENEPYPTLDLLEKDIMEFITNHGKNEKLSDSPKDAVVSIKTDRGTSFAAFIHVLDRVQGAYYELRAKQAGISIEDYRNLDLSKSDEYALYQKGKKGLPMQISIAEPTNIQP